MLSLVFGMVLSRHYVLTSFPKTATTGPVLKSLLSPDRRSFQAVIMDLTGLKVLLEHCSPLALRSDSKVHCRSRSCLT